MRRISYRSIPRICCPGSPHPGLPKRSLRGENVMNRYGTRTATNLVAYASMLLLTAILSPALAQDASTAAYLNPALTPQQRAADLVQRMTLEEKASQMENEAAAIPRLNVTAYMWWSEALHGVADNGVTEFPEPIGLGATFDDRSEEHTSELQSLRHLVCRLLL